MKITDLALVFVGVILPLMIVVYINVSFNIKAQEQEMYYQNIIDIAAQDAANQMKEVENDDTNIDYGYSGKEDQKVSVNAQIAVDTFLNNLYNNFNIKSNPSAQRYLQLFVPAIAVIDYDGVQMSSIESVIDKTDKDVIDDKIPENQQIIKHVLKPKRFYSYTYTIQKEGPNYKMVDGLSNDSLKDVSYHEIEFTMDDYITHRGCYKNGGGYVDSDVKGFYIEDPKNNDELVYGVDSIKNEVISKLKSIRKDVIVNTLVKEMAYATNNNNSYAKNAGINYDFSFPSTTTDEVYGTIKNVGFIAFVQGLSVGNKYLNTKAYGVNNLELATRYYFSIPSDKSKFKLNLYHKDLNCPEFKVSVKEDISPRYALTKQQATIMRVKCKNLGTIGEYQGFYPCPICNP